MDEKTGKLSHEDKIKAARWIDDNSTDGGPICSVCASNNWQVADYLSAPPVYRGKDDQKLFWEGGGPAYPYIVLSCKKCANAVFFNAISIGVLSFKEEAGDDADNAS